MLTEADNIKQQVDLKITKQLFVHSPFAIFSTIFNTIVVIFVFNDVAEPQILHTWATVSISYLLMRFFFTRHVIKSGITLNNLKLRLRQFTITIFISGLIFGSAGILFLSIETPAYNSFIFFLMGGMFAGSLGAYAINQRVFYAFSSPVILPVTVYSFVLGGPINTAMAVMGVVFIIMMFAVVRRMNFTMTEAFTLSIENKRLAENTKQLNEKLCVSNENFKALSFKDTMTNISNRRFISEIINPEMERFAFSLQQSINNNATTDSDYIYAIYIIDIDHFKDVNDTWGHKCGDEMIIQIVNIIKSLIRKEDVICRWGGEEFVVILKRTNPDYIEKFAQKLMDEIRSTQFLLSESIAISKTCSIGYAKFPFFDELPLALCLDQTIEIADQALYHAKENGRNKAVHVQYKPTSRKEICNEHTKLMINDMRKTLKIPDISLSEY